MRCLFEKHVRVKSSTLRTRTAERLPRCPLEVMKFLRWPAIPMFSQEKSRRCRLPVLMSGVDGMFKLVICSSLQILHPLKVARKYVPAHEGSLTVAIVRLSGYARLTTDLGSKGPKFRACAQQLQLFAVDRTC